MTQVVAWSPFTLPDAPQPYWDLPRQRRAHDEFGRDPDDASLRDEETVERYEQ